jgi:hypothetical protein
MRRYPTIGTVSGKPLHIDVDALIRSRLLLQANSGGGKSWALRRLLEQTHGSVQQLVIDLDDEFLTLREKFDYVVAAPSGGDCPADPRSAALLARRLLELRVSAIMAVHELKHAQRIEFVRQFIDALVNAPKSLWHPVLVFIDEAHVFCPEKAEAASAGAVIDLMTRGRKRGFCGVLATQRLAELSATARAMATNKLIGLCSIDIDVKRGAKELGFTTREQENSLGDLLPGQFYVRGPAFDRKVQLAQVGDVETTHPEAGEQVQSTPPPPRDKIRKVLGELADLPQAAEEEARTLAEAKARIRHLEAELRKKPAPQPVDIEIVEVPVLPPGLAERIAEHASLLKAGFDNVRGSSVALTKALDEVARAIATVGRGTARTAPPTRPPAPALAMAPRLAPAAEGGDVSLPEGEKAVLTAVAQNADGTARDELTVLTGYKRSTRDAYIQRLRGKELVELAGDKVIATQKGVDALGPSYQPLPTGAELLEHWRARLPEGERACLEVLVDSWPSAVHRDSVSEGTGFKRSTRDAYLQRLARRRLVEDAGGGQVKASALLFDGAA